MKWSELKNKPVVAVASGEKLGFVDDLFLDTAGRQILGVRTRTGGLLTHHAAMLWTGIEAIGDDAVTVKDASVLNEETTFSDLKDARRAEAILGTTVMTVSGQEVGRVADLSLDLQSQSVLDYALGVGLIDRLRGEDRLIPVSGIRSVGADAIVVEDAAASQPV